MKVNSALRDFQGEFSIAIDRLVWLGSGVRAPVPGFADGSTHHGAVGPLKGDGSVLQTLQAFANTRPTLGIVGSG
jgi:hypothetical protein